MTAITLAEHQARSFAFGPFVLVPERQLLLQDDKAVRIGGRALDILTALVERPGAVVSKTELLARVWPDTAVEESNLKVNMSVLRRVLGETTGAGAFIATVVGQGYRFVAPVEARAPDAVGASDVVPAPVASPSHNLPAGTTRILGRNDAMAAVATQLDETRLVSIVGTGGVGKTTLAIGVATQTLERFADGVWLVDLAPLGDANLTVNAIATAVGMTAHSSNMLAALCEYLQGRTTLLVLDNCEHVIDAAATCVARILAAAPRVKVLATSREPLRVKGEHVRRLSGLSVPPQRAHVTAAEALGFSAVQLFVERASERLESFRLEDADASKLAELCRRLDGVALAIELAATHVDVFGVDGILRQLDRRLGFLKGHRGGAARHRTLGATLDWSYDLLPDAERRVLGRLATFAGPFSLEAACAVASDEQLDGGRVVDVLANLVAKSLVAADLGPIEVEYRQLETTRAYALEKLAAGGDLDEARCRHAEHVLTLAEVAGATCASLSRAEWLARHGSCLDEIRTALAWSVNDASNASLTVKLTVAALPFWKQLSLVEECRVAAERALGPRFEAHRSVRDTLALNIARGATLLHTRGPLLAVKVSLMEALEVAERLGDVALQVECLRPLSEYEMWTGDSKAVLLHAEKLRALSALGHAEAGGDADAQQGSALRWIGDLEGSRVALEKVVVRPLRERDRLDAGRFEIDQRLTALSSLSQVLWLQGFPDRAVETVRRQRALAETTNFAASRCLAMLQGVSIGSLVGDLEGTARGLDELEHYAREHQLDIWGSMVVCQRGRWLVDMGRKVDLDAFHRALTDLYESGLRIRYPTYLAQLSWARAHHGDLAGALESIEEVLDHCRSSGHLWGVPEALRMKGTYLHRGGAAGAVEAAAACFLQSIEAARAQGTLSWELRSACSLVELGGETRQEGEARAMLASAYGRFTEGFETRDLRHARQLLASAAPPGGQSR